VGVGGSVGVGVSVGVGAGVGVGVGAGVGRANHTQIKRWQTTQIVAHKSERVGLRHAKIRPLPLQQR
jgi:pantoate kinase